MAKIHINEIRQLLIDKGRYDSIDSNGNPKIEFLEISFEDVSNRDNYVIDEEMVSKAIPVETYFASGVIQFDHRGCLISIDFS